MSDVRLPEGATTRRKRRGRGPGSGRGKTAGRGTKGFMARTGSQRRPGFEGGSMPLIRRIPKRGFRNRFRVEYAIVNLASLERLEAHAPITPEVLRTAGLVHGQRRIKILGDGECAKPFHVQAHKFSQSAVAKLAKAGGRAEVIPT